MSVGVWIDQIYMRQCKGWVCLRIVSTEDPCPATGSASGSCKGYVIDHVVALKSGGADKAANMQWQTREAAKAKDLVE